MTTYTTLLLVPREKRVCSRSADSLHHGRLHKSCLAQQRTLYRFLALPSLSPSSSAFTHYYWFHYLTAFKFSTASASRTHP